MALRVVESASLKNSAASFVWPSVRIAQIGGSKKSTRSFGNLPIALEKPLARKPGRLF